MRKETIGPCELWLGDCREVMAGLEAGSVDAVVTDPPYGVGLAYSGHDDAGGEQYAEWCRLWFADCQAVCEGPIGISCGVGNLQMWPKANWVFCWNKPNAMGRAVTGFNTWEPVLVYGKIRGVRTHDSFTVALVPQTDTGDHPCPKPVGWAREVIYRLTVAGHSVLDPFMGSGTTGVACIRTNRRFIGCEIDPGYFDIACRRIEREWRFKQSELPFEPVEPAVQREMF